MLSFNKIIFFILTILLFIACNDKVPVNQVITQKNEEMEAESPFLRGSRKKVVLENEDIDLFIKRYGWNMIKTETGLRYEILSKGKGRFPKEGDKVEIQFTTQLLTGDTVYTSKEKGLITFTVNKTDQIVGLHEAVQLIPKGSKVHLIIPSYLAYGISGDGDRIIGQKSLVMTIELLNK
jgi:FKBP-type peptidyl-prolyl cis-trans isomerase FkpA